MKQLILILSVLLCAITVLFGCHHSTHVILPPESLGNTTAETIPSSEPVTVPDEKPTTVPTTESTTAPTAEPTTVPTTEPTSAPTTEPTTVPTTEPTTAPTTEPTTVPTTEPTTAPTTEPTTVPTTEPTTAPTTEPTTVPTTEPTSAPTAEPTTVPTTEPTTAPTTEPATQPETHPVYDISNHTIGSMENNLLDGINEQRSYNELDPLVLDPTLSALSAIRAYECVENFSHVRPDGRDPRTVLSDYSYDLWSTLSEKIHQGTATLSPSIILKGWMRNEAFSASILNDTFTHIGIGIYTIDGIAYIVCLFAG